MTISAHTTSQDPERLSTDYGELRSTIAALADRCASLPYDECVDAMMTAMKTEFPGLTTAGNHVLSRLDTLSPSEVRFIIQEYSGFSNAAVHMLFEARIRSRWPVLTTEIVRNLDEEMGVLTKGIPHLELMRWGYRHELGIETDDISYSDTTLELIDRLNQLFRTRDTAALAGVLLAFEGTAVDEFRAVDRILRKYKALEGGVIAADSLTGIYVAGHVTPDAVDDNVDPEMEHYQGLVSAIGNSIGSAGLRPLVGGFLSVCLELNRWWDRIAIEAVQTTIRNALGSCRSEQPDVYKALTSA